MNDQEILLATVMMRPKAWSFVCAMGFTSEFFLEDIYRDLWEAIKDTELAQKTHRTSSFLQRAKNDGTKHLITRLTDGFKHLQTDEIETTARRVMGAKRLRDLSNLSKATAEDIERFRIGDDIAGIATATKSMARIADNLLESNVQKVLTGIDLGIDYKEFCEKRMDIVLSGAGLGISTGIKEIDDCFGGGFRQGEMVIVAGRTGSGKTQFGVHMAIQAIAARKKVLFFSTEMHRNALLDRFCSRYSNLDSRLIRSGALTDDQCDRFSAAIKTLGSNDDLVIFDDFKCRLSLVESSIELEMRSSKPPEMVVIDYAQNLKPEIRYKDAWTSLREVSSVLKNIVTRHKISLVVLAQLNRESTKIPPEVSHILGCDSFAHDCDAAVLLHVTPKLKEHNLFEIRLRKMRYGEEANLFVSTDLSTSKFTNPNSMDVSDFLNAN